MANDALDVEQIRPDTVCVTPRGELDLDSAYEFDDAVRRVQEESAPGTVVVDLREVTFVDSAGLGRLVALARRGRRLGERVCFVRGPRSITRLFALTGASVLVDWIQSPEDASRPPRGLRPRVS